MVLLELFLGFIFCRFRIEEEVRVGVAVVFDLRRAGLAIAEREVADRAGGEAFDAALAIVSNLLIQRVIAHHGNHGHGADRPKQETQQSLNEVDPHMLRHVFFFVTELKRHKW